MGTSYVLFLRFATLSGTAYLKGVSPTILKMYNKNKLCTTSLLTVNAHISIFNSFNNKNKKTFKTTLLMVR